MILLPVVVCSTCSKPGGGGHRRDCITRDQLCLDCIFACRITLHILHGKHQELHQR
jgi:hypothetical protein